MSKDKSARKPYTAEEKARHALQTKARKMAAENLIKAHAEEYATLLVAAKAHYGVEDRTTRLAPEVKAGRLVEALTPDLAAALTDEQRAALLASLGVAA